VTAVAEYAEGVPVGYMDGWEDQRIEAAYFLPVVLEAGAGWGSHYPQTKEAMPLGRVDAVAISEVLSDLSGIVARAGA
jgi:hypothetical protein